MGKIIVLDENTSNKIAAGEVIERPSSVVKELVENSIDAGASMISVEIKNGGISYIKITDNGSGIEEDDVEIAFERHATSKIRSSNDLDSIATLGFRGEALASIAAVSSVELTSRVQKNPHGMYIKVQGGHVQEVKPTGCPVGTTFVIKDLFYNTPARFKFLKKDSTEAGYISDILSRIALGNPHISVKLISNHVTILHTPGNNDLLSTIYSVYGKDTAREVLPCSYSDSKVVISGFVGKPEIARSNRNQQSIFINGRYIRSKIITSAIDEAYKTFLMKNKYPFIVMNLQINPILVDINVHPTKMEVRFSEEQDIFRSVYHAVNNALLGKNLTKEIKLTNEPKEDYKFKNERPYKADYSQQKFSFNESYVKDSKKEVYGATRTSIQESKPVMKEPVFLQEEPKSLSVPTSERRVFEEVSKSAVPNIEKKEIQYPNFLKHQNQQAYDAKEKIEEIKEEVVVENNQGNDAQDEIQSASCAKQNNVTEQKKEYEVEKSGHTFSDYTIVGQVFSTYIILQYENDMVLIDQHAAHERIMYERLKNKYKNKESLSQVLLAPLVIELTYKEIKFLEEEKEFFNTIGFNFENFGNNSIILRTVPIVHEKNELKEAFLEILDHVIKATNKEMESAADETLYTIACKSAVKANMWLGEIEIKKLLKDLDIVDNPFTCPHGRPTAIKISKQELEKKFKRIL
ncbi:MAG: DNA mismatch repair endonuclease MutL [Clostridia bacterium]|nr:DNA mismatch repair endonuclease MutL [Clostridia bacterium]